MSHMPPFGSPVVAYYWNADSVPLVFGTPVYVSAVGQVKRASAAASITAVVLGVVVDTSVAVGAQARVMPIGTLSGSVAQWNALTGGTTGLTRGTSYYLSATAGLLVSSAPIDIGSLIVYIGTAASTTDLDVSISVAAGPIAGLPLAVNTNHVVSLGDSQTYSLGSIDLIEDRDLVNAYTGARMTETIGSGNIFVADYVFADRDLQPYVTSGASGMSPMLTFGRGYNMLRGAPVKISKWASRGSALGGTWVPYTGNYWPLITAFLDAQVLLYGPIGAVYLDLGTNDSNTFSQANAWAANCKALMTALRARYGNFTVAIRQTSTNLDPAYPYWATVRAQQLSYVSDDLNAVLIGADDVPLATDNLHLVSGGYGVLGYRAATELAARKGPTTPFVGGAFPRFVGTVQGVSGAGTLVPLSFPCPTDIAGFFDILVVATGFLGSGRTKATLSDAAGFVEVGSQKSAAGGAEQWLTLFFRRVTSRHMGNPTVADNNDLNAAKIFSFWQPTTTAGNAWDVATFSANNLADPNIAVAGVTTLSANSLVAYFGANYGGSPRTATGWADASLTNVANVGFADYTITDHEIIFCSVGQKAAVGASGTMTATANQYLVGAYCTMAIKP